MASLSLGGWAGSQYFSSAVATAENRTKFSNAILNLVSTYNLDGIDFEYGFSFSVARPYDLPWIVQLGISRSDRCR